MEPFPLLVLLALSTPPTPDALHEIAVRDLPAPLIDDTADGVLWARGNRWKMRFDATGAVYYPALGARAPRNSALRLRLVEASRGGVALGPRPDAPPVRDGLRVDFDRGPITERFHLAADSVEQDFVLWDLAGTGDLVLRIDAAGAGDLAYAGKDGEHRLVAPGLGEVRYGDALVRDGRGRTLPRTVVREDEQFVIVVPAAFLASATAPVVVDPVITTLTVDATDSTHPDVAYDALVNRWLVVFEDNFSAADRDVVAHRYDKNGNLLDIVAVDITTEDTIEPRVASTPGQFLVVWTENAPGLFGVRKIRGRTRLANAAAQGTPFTIKSGDLCGDAEVGGSDQSAGFPYLVAWQELPFVATSFRIAACRVSTQGATDNDFIVSKGNDSRTDPRITATSGPGDAWMIVYEELTGGTGQRLDAAIVRGNGTLEIADFTVANAGVDLESAHPAGDGTEFMVVWEATGPGQHHVFGERLSRKNGLHTLSGDVDLTVAEGLGTKIQQFSPAVAQCGPRFTYAYVQGNVFASTLFGATQFTYTEKHAALLVPSSSGAGALEIAAAGFDDPGRFFIVGKGLIPPVNNIVIGGIYDGLLPGGVTVVQTDCGGSGQPGLLFNGTPAPGAEFSLLPLGFSNAVLAIGAPAALPICPGQSGCVLGAQPTLLVAVPQQVLPFVIPPEPNLLGLTVAIQGIDLIAGTPAGAHCGPPFTNVPLRVSDTLHVTFQ